MGKISKATIRKEQRWYNPLFVRHNRMVYEVKNFVLYNPETEEVIAETNHGWFSETPKLNEMEFYEMELRNKADLKLKHPFFMRVKSDLSYEGRTMAKVYIPAVAESVKYETTKGFEGMSYKYRVTDVVMSGIDIYNARIREYMETITTAAHDKRQAIANKCNMDAYTLNKVLKVLRDEGYEVSDLISED